MPTPSTDHATHDAAIVAALSAREPDLDPADAVAGQALVAACTECARLHADLLALAVALPSAATPRRTRDFTLSAADAERLRPHGLRAWLARIGTTRDTVTRPLALGFTTLGLAGLLLATVPSVLPMASSGAAPSTELAAPEAPAPSAAAALQMSAEPSPVDDGEVFTGSDSGDPGPAATAGPAGGGDVAAAPDDATNLRDDGSGLSTLVVIAGTLLIVGLGLFALRWSARRLGDG